MRETDGGINIKETDTMQQKIILILSILFLTQTNCFSQNRKQIAKSGFVNEKDYLVEIPFSYIGKHIFIEVLISDKKYNFLFDTGYEISAIDQDISKEISYTLKKEIELSGSSVSTQKVRLIELSNISISNVSFEKTYGMLQDLSLIKPNYETIKISGIIGNNLMRKANWQIDYKKSVIRISDKTNKFDIPKTSQIVTMKNQNWGLGYIDTQINTKTYKFIFDLGSSGKFTANTSFIENLDQKKTTNPEELKQKFPIDKIKIGEIELYNQSLSLEKGVASLIGNAFFEDYLLTIDWKKNILHLTPYNN